MKPINSLSTVPILIFAFAYGISSALGDVPETFSAENPEAAHVRVEDVSQYSGVFLSDTKTSPAIDVGYGMTLRLEIEEPDNHDEAMNAARKAIGETPEVKEAAMKELADVLKNDGEYNVPWENAAWLVRFLRLRNYDVSETYELIKRYYNFKSENDAIFKDLVPSEEREVAEQGVMGVLAKRDPVGSRIVLASTRKWNSEKYSLLQLIKLGMVFAETGSYEPATQLAGVQVIFDAGGLTWQHVKQFNPNIAKLLVQWLLTSAPIKITGIHVLNQSNLFGTLFNMFKPFMTEELNNKIHLHGTNIKSLYQYIPAAYLPDILGGPYSKRVLSSYEWDILLKSGDEEFAKIGSYGLKRKL